MRKILLILFCAFMGFASVSAQDIFKKGDKVLDLGIGFGNTLYTGSGYSTKVPPISAGLEVCVKDNLFDNKSSLGIGGMVGYSASEYKYNSWGFASEYKHKYTDFVIAAKGALHYQFVDKLDTYAGVSLGYDIVSGSSSGDYYGGYSVTSSGLFLGVYAGARYYFSDNIAAMAELGYDIAVFKVGISFKF